MRRATPRCQSPATPWRVPGRSLPSCLAPSATSSSPTSTPLPTGRAPVVATASSRAGGPYAITATALDGSGNPTSVTASTSVTNLPGSPAQLTATSLTVSVTVAQQTNLQVTVLDAAGNAITSQPQ